MNLVSTEKINTTNAWGFGGIIGTIETYDNGIRVIKGRRYYRHSNPTTEWKMEVYVENPHLDNFWIDVQQSKGYDEVRVYQSEDGNSYFASRSDKDTYNSKYNGVYKLHKIVKL